MKLITLFFLQFYSLKDNRRKRKTLDPKIVQAFLSTPRAVNKTLRIILSLLLFQKMKQNPIDVVCNER